MNYQQTLLDYKIVDSLHLKYQEMVRTQMLSSFTLNDDFKSTLINVDLDKKAFTPDLFCLYLTALINGNYSLNTTGLEWFLDVYQDVKIDVIDPTTSIADDFFAKNAELHTGGAEFSIPMWGCESIRETAQQIRTALVLLASIKSSCSKTKLLNSIAIFSGNDTTATSGVTGAAQGRIFIREVTLNYPDFYYLDMMIHEISHLYFNLIAQLHPLISDYTKTFFSVAKNRERPIFGIFNATFVLYRLITVYPEVKNLLKKSELPLEKNTSYEKYLYSRFFHIPFNYEFRLNLYQMKFDIAYEQLLSSNALTSAGKELLVAMHEELISK
ncbi:MAG: hypothetical protein Q8R83_07970 [Legionellaceae bacterium]|nr:hypothetical protein [Legionellaceae bacterium]